MNPALGGHRPACDLRRRRLLTYPNNGARPCSTAATCFFRSVNRFDTPLTPRTDRAALPAREICQLSGTDPVSVTTPRCALTRIAESSRSGTRLMARRTSRIIASSVLLPGGDVETATMCAAATGGVLTTDWAFAQAAQLAMTATSVAPNILLASFLFMLLPLGSFNSAVAREKSWARPSSFSARSTDCVAFCDVSRAVDRTAQCSRHTQRAAHAA
jgi:hypothetical protein